MKEKIVRPPITAIFLAVFGLQPGVMISGYTMTDRTLHMLVPDGAYTFANAQARFHRAPVPSEFELEQPAGTSIPVSVVFCQWSTNQQI